MYLNKPNIKKTFQETQQAVILKIRSQLPKSNQLFILSKWYIQANLVRISPLDHVILCTKESVKLTIKQILKLMPMPSYTKNCPQLLWRDNMILMITFYVYILLYFTITYQIILSIFTVLSLLSKFLSIWTGTWQNPTKWVCTQLRLRSAWASAQSDQSLRCALNG